MPKYIAEVVPSYCGGSTPCYEGQNVTYNCAPGYAWGSTILENRSATCFDYLGYGNQPVWLITGGSLCDRVLITHFSIEMLIEVNMLRINGLHMLYCVSCSDFKLLRFERSFHTGQRCVGVYYYENNGNGHIHLQWWIHWKWFKHLFLKIKYCPRTVWCCPFFCMNISWMDKLNSIFNLNW